MEISHHLDNYQMTDSFRDLIGFLRYSADYDLVDGLETSTRFIWEDNSL